MRTSLALLLLATLVVAGCVRKQETGVKPVAGATGNATSTSPAAATKPAGKPAGKPAPGPTGPLVVTPASTLAGKVARYNDAGRFVVLEFSAGRMPALEQRLSVYRNGLKVGELKVTGPHRDDHIVADVTSGEAQAGDEVRDR